MTDTSTYWLTMMNYALGVVTLLGVVAVVIGVWQELAAKRRKRAELARLDREVSDLVASYDGHAFHMPSLGVTMADGGEDMNKQKGK